MHGSEDIFMIEKELLMIQQEFVVVDQKEDVFQKIEKLEHLREKLKYEIESAPLGRICIINRNNRRIHYYKYYNKKKSYLSKTTRMPEIKSLAQKEYHEKLLKNVTEQIQYLKLTIEKRPLSMQSVYENMADLKKKIVTPVILTDEMFVERWYQEHPGGMNTYPFDKEIITNRGERVRSKSEKFLADLFYQYHIPYVYEPEIQMKSGKILYPDFLLLNVRLRKTILFEHFGKMGDLEYANKNCRKIKVYSDLDYILGDTFLLSMESEDEIINTQVVEKMIIQHLL